MPYLTVQDFLDWLAYKHINIHPAYEKEERKLKKYSRAVLDDLISMDNGIDLNVSMLATFKKQTTHIRVRGCKDMITNPIKEIRDIKRRLKTKSARTNKSLLQ